jgi:hypothetical protein
VLNISYTDAVRQFARELPGATAEPDPRNADKVSDALARFERLEKAADPR